MRRRAPHQEGDLEGFSGNDGEEAVGTVQDRELREIQWRGSNPPPPPAPCVPEISR